MKKLLLLAFSLPLLIQAQVAWAASSSDFKLQILPLDCQFEIVQDGLNTITYLTPELCGQVVSQPPTQPNTPGTTSAGTPYTPRHLSSNPKSPSPALQEQQMPVQIGLGKPNTIQTINHNPLGTINKTDVSHTAAYGLAFVGGSFMAFLLAFAIIRLIQSSTT